MSTGEIDLRDATLSSTPELPSRLPFPPVTKSHILHCSVHHWYPIYRKLTPKTRLIPLPSAFTAYLRADGILLPPEPSTTPFQSSTEQAIDSGFSEGEGDDDDDAADHVESDPSQNWPQVHAAIKAAIADLGGTVHPKLNWSAPKDATWIAANNSMECTTANDVYLLLKSSDFVAHDLEQAFDDCSPDPQSRDTSTPTQTETARRGQHGVEIPYHLALRKTVPALITSMEFRCFVRARRLVAVCQRDLNHYDFLAALVPVLQELIYDFFEAKLKMSFPDPDFVFDVYVPQPREGARVWLLDVNPWAPRTDPLLFSWLEVLTMPDLPAEGEGDGLEGGVARLSLRTGEVDALDGRDGENGVEAEAESANDEEDSEEDLPYLPEIRLVKRDDPETYSFNTPLYSAHKLPKDVVDAGMGGQGGIRDFLERVRRREREPEYNSDDDE